MPIEEAENVDVDVEEEIVLDGDTEELEVEESEEDDQDSKQDDSQDDDNLEENSDDESDNKNPEPVASRGQKRHQVLVNRAKVAEAEAARVRDELRLERERVSLSRRVESDEAEAARLAAMDPVQRDAYEAKKESNSTKQALAYLHFEMKDSSDKSMYAAKAVANPLYAKYEDRVEAKLAQMRKDGQNSTREVILDFLIGRDARTRAEKGASSTKKKSAASRVDAAQGKPARARSDAGGYKSKGKTAADRLEGVLI